MINRQELVDKLKQTIETYVVDKTFVSFVGDEIFRQHQMDRGNTNYILYHPESLPDKTDEELFWLVQATNKYVRNKIDIKSYFTSHEMIYENTRVIVENKEVYPLVFDNMIRVKTDQFIGVIDIDTLYSLYENQIINYNFNTQRNRRKGQYKPYVNKRSVKEISQLMKDDDYVPDTITLNLNKDNPEVDYSYDEDNNRLIVRAGQLDIPDGYHRYRALIQTKLDNPDWEYTMELRIVNHDESKANKLISQSNKRNEINKTFLKTLNDKDPINMLINRLNEDSRSLLKDRISKQNMDAYYAPDFYSAIETYIKELDKNSVASYNKYLREVFNALVEDELFFGTKLEVFMAIKAAEQYRLDSDYISKIESYMTNKPDVNSIQKNKIVKALG